MGDVGDDVVGSFGHPVVAPGDGLVRVDGPDPLREHGVGVVIVLGFLAGMGSVQDWGIGELLSRVGAGEVDGFLPDLFVVLVAQKQHPSGELCHGLGKGRSLLFGNAAKHDAIASLGGVPFLPKAHPLPRR